MLVIILHPSTCMLFFLLSQLSILAHEVSMCMSRFQAHGKFGEPERGVRVAKVLSRQSSCAAHFISFCLSFPPAPHPPPSPLFPMTLFAGCLAAFAGDSRLGCDSTCDSTSSWTSQAPNRH